MIITDEMVEIAREAMESYPMRGEVRAALEAVAPMLIAQALQDAPIVSKYRGLQGLFLIDYAHWRDRIRAQELDPK
ncbi:MAG: hypothetical protein EHM33_33315 [Chloroflexi bacterium]|nr:MAG: hypothetical protein EHM33_33315 [Chloroflexota bacterium]